MFSLIYIERPKRSDAQSALCGPFAFEEKTDALKKVFDYAKDRVLGCCPRFFAESISALGSDNLSDDEVYSAVKSYLDGVSDACDMENLANWWFDYANDEVVEAYYSISSLELSAKEVKSSFDFILRDHESEEGDVSGTVSTNPYLGLSVSVNGYSDCSSEDDDGCLVYVEKYEDELQVRIYGDINKEEPSHNISLEGARNSLRITDAE